MIDLNAFVTFKTTLNYISFFQDYFLIFLENLNPLQSLVNLTEVWYEILLHICWRCNVYSYNLRPQIVDLFVV